MSTNPGPLLSHIIMSLSTLIDRQFHDLEPSHEDFYLLGGGLIEIISQLRTLTTILQRQVRGYDVRALCCDTGGDPRERLSHADDQLETIRETLTKAGIAARAYKFTAGHIVVDPPTAVHRRRACAYPREQRRNSGLIRSEPAPALREPDSWRGSSGD